MSGQIDSSKWTGAKPAWRVRDDALWDEAQELLNDACAENLPRDHFDLNYQRAMNAVMDALAKYKPKPWLEEN